MRAEYLILIYVCLNIVMSVSIGGMIYSEYWQMDEAFFMGALGNVGLTVILCWILHARYKHVNEEKQVYQAD